MFLLRILANDEEAIREARKMTGINRAALLVVAELYVKEVLLFSGAPPRRVLGLPANAGRAEARVNLKFLLSWLHPDKNPSKWQSAFATRVIAAWHLVKDGQAPHDLEQPEPRRSRAHSRYRLPLIAQPLGEGSSRPRLRLSRPASIFLVVFFAIGGIVVPNDAAFSVYQNLATIILDGESMASIVPSDVSSSENGNTK